MSFLSRFTSTKRPAKKVDDAPAASSMASTLPISLDLPDLPSPSFANGHSSTPSASSIASGSERGGAWVRVTEPSGEGKEVTRAREELEKKKLGKARLGVASANVLMDLCSQVVRERGSTTLGIYRPYRLAEDAREIRKLSLLFLAYSDAATAPASTSGHSDSVARDLFGAGENSKEGFLKIFQDELKYASVHDVIGLLKWGLRHLRYSTSFSGNATNPLTWYTTFLPLAAPPDSFTTHLLPTLPASSQSLLLSTLSLIEPIAAQAEINAMGARRLSRNLGAYLFGALDADSAGKEWTDAYSKWVAAGNAMEGTFKAYLRAQGVEGLPRRLKEVVGAWPRETGLEGRKVKVLKIEMVTTGEWRESGVNDQATGLEGADGARKRRKPLVILSEAFEAKVDGAEPAGEKAWAAVKQIGKGAPLDILSDETTRILELVGLASTPSPTSPTLSDLLSPPTSPSRRRSFSHDPTLSSLSEEPQAGSFSPYGTTGRFAHKSVGNLVASKSNTSWSDFAASGFGDELPSELGLLPVRTPFNRAQTIGPSSTKSSSRPSSSPRYPSEGSAPVKPRLPSPKPVSTIKSIQVLSIDDEFQDFFLDTLVDPACDAWPSFFLSDLNASVIAELAAIGISVDHLLVSEVLVPLEPDLPLPPSLNRSLSNRSTKAGSIADSTLSRRWNKRMSSLFTPSISSKRLTTSGAGLASSDSLPPPPVLPASPPESLRKKKSSRGVVPPLPTLSPVHTNGTSKSDAPIEEKALPKPLPVEKDDPQVPAKVEAIPEVVPVTLAKEDKRTSSLDHATPVFVVPAPAPAPSPPISEESSARPDSPTAPDIPEKAVNTAPAIPPRNKARLSSTKVPTVALLAAGGAISAAVFARASSDTQMPDDKTPRKSVELPPISREEGDLHEGHPAEMSEARTLPEAEPKEPSDGIDDKAGDDSLKGTEKLEPVESNVEKEVAPEIPTMPEQSTDGAREFEAAISTHLAEKEGTVSTHGNAASQAEANETPQAEGTNVAPEDTVEPVSTSPEAPTVKSPSIVEEADDPTSSSTERKASVETLRKSPVEAESPEGVQALEQTQTSEEALPSSEVSTPTPSTPASMDTTPTKARPNPGASLGGSLATVLSNSSETSTMAPPSLTSGKSKKGGFLGSSAIGGLLRRKKSSMTSEVKVEKLTKAELKEAKKKEAIEQKKEVPRPVSSVRQRVLEIEAAAKAEAAAALAEESKETVKPSVSGSSSFVDIPSAGKSASFVEIPAAGHSLVSEPAAADSPVSLDDVQAPSTTPTPASATALPLLDDRDNQASSDDAEATAPIPLAVSEGSSPVDTHATPTLEKHSELPTSPTHTPAQRTETHAPGALELEHHSEKNETLHSGASTPNSGGSHYSHAAGEALAPVLSHSSSVPSLAETTTSFQTADSEQSL
ncbi:hypothetical protein P7C70_g5050, partial [Phenoliferia sp. Uapishka_3]